MSIHQLQNENFEVFTDQLKQAVMLGVDTEFHAERRFTPILHLIQIHVEGGDTWVIDPAQKKLIRTAAPLLLQKQWVVHGGRFDLILLHEVLGSLPEKVWDTQIAAGLLELHYPSPYARLLELHLNMSVPKHATLSNWARRPLSSAQIEYAAADVIPLLDLWKKIQLDLENIGRNSLAETLCLRQTEETLSPPASDTLYRHHYALPFFNRQQAAVFQELYSWRHDVAKSKNQPARSLLNDGLLVELSKRQPSTVDGLRMDRRMPKKFVSNYGETILEIIQRAASRPEWGLPHFIRAFSKEFVQLRVLEAAIIQDGHEHGYSQRLVFPTHFLEDIILMDIQDEEALVKKIGPLRAELIGERMWPFFPKK